MGLVRETRRSGQHARSSAAVILSGPHGAGPEMVRLEVGLQCELQNAWVEGRGVPAKVAGPEIAAHLVELGVIPRVESLDAEFHSAATSFAEDEALEQRQVPVVAAGTAHRVVAEVAKGTHRRSCKGGRIEVLDGLVPSPSQDRAGVGNLANEVRTVGRVGQAITTLAAGETNV